jgi:hypothetical protein
MDSYKTGSTSVCRFKVQGAVNNLMILTALMFIVALALSAVAAFYSIVGLTAIFAAATIPIVIMGSILEVAKLVVTVWLHEYWDRCKLTMKLYLVPAVGILMLITSMGIFGFLSKAHMDQGMISGDVQAKIAIYDEKIKTEKENIETARRALKQMDEGVDQVLGRSTSETGADRAVALRRSQQKERGRLLAEISQSQKLIAELNEARAPIAAEVRKVEAEVGPIKYIAALIYGDDPDTNTLERAVRWVIIILVAVFDPLAVMMLLASTESRKWWLEDRRKRPEPEPDPDLPQDETPSSDTDPEPETDTPKDETVIFTAPKLAVNPHVPGWMYPPMQFHAVVSENTVRDTPTVENDTPVTEPDLVEDQELAEHDDEHNDDDSELEKQAKKLWKHDNPESTLKDQRRLLARGVIDHLPWEDYYNDPRIVNETKFGFEFPKDPTKGDMFVNTISIPTRLFKYNGEKWIEVDKTKTDLYTYNSAYIDYLIGRIKTGEYDPELLTDSEQAQIEQRLTT